MAPFIMTYYSIGTAIVIAQVGLGVSSWSPSWPGNTGQCIVDPQPGYHFTALQICTTGSTSYTTHNSYDNTGTTYHMDGSLYSAFLTAGSDPTAGVSQPWDDGFWINTMQYAVYNSFDPSKQPTQFYPLTDFDLNKCTQYACQDGQPCAFWGNTGSPWVPFNNTKTPGAFTWWNETQQRTYGPGNGYLLLDYMDGPNTLNERDTANTWFDCKPATQPLCTDIPGIVVNYLYDCAARNPATLPSPGGKQYNSGLNNHRWGNDCGSDNNGAIGILLEAVKLYYNGVDKEALTTQPIYCNDNSWSGGPDICVFYRGVATGNGTRTYDLLKKMHDVLGGNSCGSIGVEYPTYNVEAYGFLTVGQKGDDCYPRMKFDIDSDGVKGSAWACAGFPHP